MKSELEFWMMFNSTKKSSWYNLGKKKQGQSVQASRITVWTDLSVSPILLVFTSSAFPNPQLSLFFTLLEKIGTC